MIIDNYLWLLIIIYDFYDYFMIIYDYLLL